jgi:hypothetical protein
MKKILEPSNKYNKLGENENKSQKNPEYSRKVSTAPTRIFETFCTQEPLDASA